MQFFFYVIVINKRQRFNYNDSWRTWTEWHHCTIDVTLNSIIL